MLKSARIRPIGVIRTPFASVDECPIQPAFSSSEGTVELLPEYRAGLKGISAFTHIILLHYFHQSDQERLQARPFLGRRQRGIFTIRSPHRPNHLGLSVVRLLGTRNGRLRVRGVDMVDGTPLLDIKPYVPDFDARPKASSGWLSAALGTKRHAQT